MSIARTRAFGAEMAEEPGTGLEIGNASYIKYIDAVLQGGGV